MPISHVIVLGIFGLLALAIIAGGTVAILAILESRSTAFGGMSGWQTDTFRQSVPTEGLSAVRLANRNGEIVVTGEPEASAVVITAVKGARAPTPDEAREALSEIEVITEREGDALMIRSEHPKDSQSGLSLSLLPWRIGRPKGRTYKVDYHVAVPSSFAAEAHSMNGPIRMTDLREVSLRTTNGHITVDRTDAVDARTTNGAITVDSASGPVTLSTTNGQIRAHLTGIVREVSISTINGSAGLTVPREVNGELDISTQNGRITVEGLDVREPRAARNRLRGILGKGGAPIRLSTINGSVTVSAE
jgi:hypothetical protein